MQVRRVSVGNVVFGGPDVVVIAGPCSIENEEMAMLTADAVVSSGAAMLRGGAWKPRTSPYSFQGLGEDALKILGKAGKKFGVPVVSEVMSPEQIEIASEYVDMLQVGARNMHNFVLLSEIGRSGMPVLLKRGFMATVEEWLLAAEYILKEGNEQIVLCERGIRTFESWTRSTLDISAVPLARDSISLPVVVDPCHAAGRRDLVLPLSMAAIGAGADGVMVEVHPAPEKALSDGGQSLTLDEFKLLADNIISAAESPCRFQEKIRR
ncbi:3-deoxy-7-phosphoheptulonate synthase [Candidatus Fermentibacteria bacterium]|nr:MAG: 3-deoxy-7-phosphoheptulonate synthase [Candidatus Fermentibacteria bacterium]